MHHILEDLEYNEEWHRFVEDVLIKNLPDIPQYDPDEDNTEIWKAKSQQRRGYELCLALLNISIGERHG